MEDTLHMKKISVTEFKEYCEHFSQKRFVFSSDHQPNNSPLGLELTFEQSYTFVSVFLAPDTIAFRNDKHSQLVFEGVDHVKLTEKKGRYRAVFEIVCYSAYSPCCSATYTIVMI